MAKDVERSDLDRLLLSNANKSINEISEITGLTPEQAAQRLSNLYDSKSALQDLYREQKLLEDLWDMKDDLKKRIEESNERNTAGLANAWRQVTSLVLDRYDKARARNREDITKIDEYHAEVMGRVLASFAESMIERFKLDGEETTIAMEEIVPNVFKMVEDNTR